MFIVHCSHGATLIFDDLFIMIITIIIIIELSIAALNSLPPVRSTRSAMQHRTNSSRTPSRGS